MTLLVEPYALRESNKRKLPMCHECLFPPAWEIRTQTTENQIVAHSCDEHVATVLYKVKSGRLGKD